MSGQCSGLVPAQTSHIQAPLASVPLSNGEWTNIGGAIDMKVYTEEEPTSNGDNPINLTSQDKTECSYSNGLSHADSPKPSVDIILNGANPSGEAREGRFPSVEAREERFPPGEAREARFPFGEAREGRFPSGDAREVCFSSGEARKGRFPSGEAMESRFPPGEARDVRFASGEAREGRFPSGESREVDFSTEIGKSGEGDHPPTSPLQSAAITSVIVEPFNRVALGTPNPPRHVEEGGRGGRLIAEEEQTCLSGGSLPIKRKIRLEMGTLRKEGSGSSSPVIPDVPMSWDEQQSALHQLAAVAERKQAEEDEMMEIGGNTPVGTPTPGTPTPGSPKSTPPPMCFREQPSSSTHPDGHGLLVKPPMALVPPLSYKPSSVAQSLPHISHSEYEIASSGPLSYSHSPMPPSSSGPHSYTPSSMPPSSGPHSYTHSPLPPSSSGALTFTPTASPLTPHRHLKHTSAPAPTPSPDSAIHSAYYSPSQSPVQSRHLSGFSSPYHSSHRTTPSLSRNNSDASQYGGSQYSCTSYSSATSPISPPHFSPSHSPVTSSRYSHHPGYPSPALPSSPLPRGGHMSLPLYSHGVILPRHDEELREDGGDILADLAQHSALTAQTGISRQQLINSPCPICGDKISGFHYGIFSCESCKGFFKRTVQNKKNYVCLRGALCPVAIATRKKCPACRFDKCLKMGMKLEAIREDRTRGGRSTYQCSYTIPQGAGQGPSSLPPGIPDVKNEGDTTPKPPDIPVLLQEIMDVEHLWFSSQPGGGTRGGRGGGAVGGPRLGPLRGAPEEGGGMRLERPPGRGEDMVQTLTMMADQRLYKLVKWCKSLPLFKNILIDDQIALLINAWCELLVLSCCYRSAATPGVIRVSADTSLTLATARLHGIDKCVEKMLNFADQLRRLKVDHYEYVSMKVIILLTSDATGLKEAEQVRDSQEKVVHALQEYTVSHYPDMTSKFGELLLRMPELQRVCQVGKEMLCLNQQAKDEEDGPGFNLLMELLRGDH